jgi:glutathione synthase/RimK-type ligase-like ATP-grasp enzyme
MIALAASSSFPELTPSDHSLVSPLARRGIEALATPWDDEKIDWGSFAAVILRSCWNYHKKPDRFRAWIAELQTKRISVWNPPPALLWNMDKIYLKELEENGVRIIPTCCTSREDLSAGLKQILFEQNWERAVIKPRIGASADDVWTTTRSNAERDESRFQKALFSNDLMIQPFVREIHQGEWSFIFVDDQYSHAVLKRPADGHYFVQNNHGGSWKLAEPVDFLVHEAKFIVNRANQCLNLKEPFLYARVDGVEVDGKFLLMELELIEPELFLSDLPRAAERMAEAIRRRVELAPRNP